MVASILQRCRCKKYTITEIRLSDVTPDGIFRTIVICSIIYLHKTTKHPFGWLRKPTHRALELLRALKLLRTHVNLHIFSDIIDACQSLNHLTHTLQIMYAQHNGQMAIAIFRVFEAEAAIYAATHELFAFDTTR